MNMSNADDVVIDPNFRPAFARTFDVARRLLAGESITCGRFTAAGSTITRRGMSGPDRRAYEDVYEAARVFVEIVRATPCR